MVVVKGMEKEKSRIEQVRWAWWALATVNTMFPFRQ